QAWLAPGMQQASLGYYDKSELRLALLELLALTVAFTIVFVRLASHWVLQRRKPLAMHPLSAAFAFVLYFASVRLPPYRIDLEYWSPLWSLGLSALSLSAVAMICNVAAGMATFTLLRRLTGSRAVALLGASYLLLEATAAHADRLTPPAPAHVALAMLLLYLSLRFRGERTWPALLFGLLVAAIVVHGVLTSSSPDRPGLEPPLPSLALLVPVLLLLALTSRKRGGSRQWSARRVFAGASLLCAVPYVFLAATRAGSWPSHAIQWVLLPAAALALYGAVRAISLSGGCGTPQRFRAAFSLGVNALLLVVCFDLFFPIDRLNRAIARYATAYESERATWYRQCAAGLACDPGAKPSLAHYVRHASRPSTQEGETRREP
ncbi:MAG TPA: hypothetical protein VGP71_11535, partial [Burkholderiales bacterium]|nr:hypothetical protein [Burkholderiales bacterium]